MPKRSYEEKIEYYMRKMEKLKDKHRCKRRRRDNSESSFDQDNEGGETVMWDVSDPLAECETQPCSDEALILPNPDKSQPEILLEYTTTQQNNSPQLQAETPIQAPAPAPLPLEPPLDPEVLSALGEATDQGPMWGQDIHNNLTQLWQPLLKKGMNKEVRDKILKQYLIPNNCNLLQAPKLNIEISAAVAEMVRLRDKKVETSQQQLGIGITAVSRAMTSLLVNDNKLEAIKILSDGCRILCDLHHSETQARIKMITPGLAKPFLNVIQDSERDETLFGVNLPEKIKASKTIEKQGLQIKKPVQPPRSNTLAQPQNILPTVRQQFQGNWTGPPRYPMSRGGRGGQRRFPAPTRRSAPTTTATSQAKPSQSRSRAPARQ